MGARGRHRGVREGESGRLTLKAGAQLGALPGREESGGRRTRGDKSAKMVSETLTLGQGHDLLGRMVMARGQHAVDGADPTMQLSAVSMRDVRVVVVGGAVHGGSHVPATQAPPFKAKSSVSLTMRVLVVATFGTPTNASRPRKA